MTVERGPFVYFLYNCATVFEILSTPTYRAGMVKCKTPAQVVFCGSKPHKNDHNGHIRFRAYK